MKGRSKGSIKKRLVESTDPIIIRVTVPDNILNNVKECLKTHPWIESQDTVPSQSGQDETEIKCTLFSEYKNDDIKEFISNITCYKSLDLDTLEFLSQYGLNQEALKSYLKLTYDYALFDKILSYIDVSGDLSTIEELAVEEILSSSVKMLLNRKFKGDILFKFLLSEEFNTDPKKQINNIKTLIHDASFNWGCLTFSTIEYENFKLLISKCDMPIDKALQKINHCMVDGNSIKHKNYKGERKNLIDALSVRAKEFNDDSALRKITEFSDQNHLFNFTETDEENKQGETVIIGDTDGACIQ